MAVESPELRHLPTIEDEPLQPTIEQSRMASKILLGLKLSRKEKDDMLAQASNRMLRLVTRQLSKAGRVISTSQLKFPQLSPAVE